ncbi:hypothetical protein CHUAL_005589 [Chamberlinius hualienensis]
MTATKKKGFLSKCMIIYYDPTIWSFTKSWIMFAGGVWIARELTGIDLMGPPPVLPQCKFHMCNASQLIYRTHLIFFVELQLVKLQVKQRTTGVLV